MRKMAKHTSRIAWVVAALWLCMGAMAIEEIPEEARWYTTFGLGHIQYEGDEAVKDGVIIHGRLGYDYSEWWGIELAGFLAPSLDVQTVGFTEPGQATVEKRRGDFESTHALGLAVDGLFHFTRWERLDPYLTVGGGFISYGEDVDGESFDLSARVGGGVMYHFNDEWAVRVDGRTFLAGNDTEANAIIDASAMWTWGAHVPPSYVATGGPLDSDGDGRLEVHLDLRHTPLGEGGAEDPESIPKQETVILDPL